MLNYRRLFLYVAVVCFAGVPCVSSSSSSHQLSSATVFFAQKIISINNLPKETNKSMVIAAYRVANPYDDFFNGTNFFVVSLRPNKKLSYNRFVMDYQKNVTKRFSL